MSEIGDALIAQLGDAAVVVVAVFGGLILFAAFTALWLFIVKMIRRNIG